MKPFRALLMLAVLSSVTACATHQASEPPTPSRAIDACVAFGPIQFSRLHDTEETIVAVKAHNAAWSAMCAK